MREDLIYSRPWSFFGYKATPNGGEVSIRVDDASGAPAKQVTREGGFQSRMHGYNRVQVYSTTGGTYTLESRQVTTAPASPGATARPARPGL